MCSTSAPKSITVLDLCLLLVLTTIIEVPILANNLHPWKHPWTNKFKKTAVDPR
jgi:hypothetical protein